MQQILGPAAGALGCGLLLLFGCGGSSFTPSEGSGGSKATAGSSSGGENTAGSSGTTNAGSSSGGSSSAGSGGNATGGSSGRGGSATDGGMSSGGAPTTRCETSSDCVDCAYPTAPQTAEQCYCAICAATPMTQSMCAANQATFAKVCADVHRPCPAIACVLPPEPVCRSHTCEAK